MVSAYAEKHGKNIALAAHDVRRAFDSFLHEEIIFDLGLPAVDPLYPNPAG